MFKESLNLKTVILAWIIKSLFIQSIYLTHAAVLTNNILSGIALYGINVAKDGSPNE